MKAAQVNTSKNDKELKQECELTAFYAVLPELRQKLGRISIALLLDSLYAHEPAIHKAEDVFMSYLIVQQEESLKKVGEKCDELETTELYQKYYQAKKIVSLKNGYQNEQVAKWFNQVAVGTRSCMKFARDLLQQLVEVSWGIISGSPVLQKKKMQFRYIFGIPSG